MPKSLKYKLICFMMIVGTIPLLLAMIISYAQGNKSLQGVIGNSFKALAFETSTKIDILLENEIAQNLRLATNPSILSFLSEQNRSSQAIDPDMKKPFYTEKSQMWSDRDEGMNYILNNQVADILDNFLVENNLAAESTMALFITNSHGVLVSSINFYPEFINPIPQAFSGGRNEAYISDLYLDEKLEEHVFKIVTPIRNQKKKLVGVIHQVYSSKEFYLPKIEPITFGGTGHVMVINSEGYVLDCPILPTGFKLQEPNLVKLVTGPEADWVLTHENGHGSKELSIIGFSPLLESNRYMNSSMGHKWFTFVWQASDELFVPTHKFFIWISSAGVISVLLIAVLGAAASEKIVRPIKQLSNITTRIGRGEKVEPIEISTGDEIESLGNEINKMNEMLQNSFSALEQQVEIKTKELREIKEYTETIFMSIPEIVLIFDQDLKIDYVNTALGKLVERPGENFVGRTLGDMEATFEGQWEGLAQALEDFAQGVVANRPRDVGGRTIYCYDARDPLAPQSPNDGSEVSSQVITVKGKIFAYQFFNVGAKDKETQKIGLMMKDITEEKKLMDQLTMAEKLSGLGTLTAGIAHEINNPLYSIMGYTEAIQNEKDLSKIKGYAAKVLNSAKATKAIVLNLSGYTRSNVKIEPHEVDVNERLDAAIEMAMMASYSDDIQLEKNYGKLSPLKSKPEEIQQIFLNIIRNAVQAMKGKGWLSISSEQLNGKIVVTIEDSGPGIPQEYLSKVFDPFFTTKGQGEGTGLGLNIVHRIVENYGGKIQVNSQTGKGAVFKISFPVVPR